MIPNTPQMLHSSGSSQHQMDAEEEVTVPRMQFKPCDELLTLLLNRQINPLQPTDGFTYNLYDLTVQIVGNHLSLNCTNCI